MNRLWTEFLCLILIAFNLRADVPAASLPDSAPNTNAIALATFSIDGFKYEEVRWGRITPATATIFHKTGVATIPLEKLPPEWQSKLGYDPLKAQRYRQAEATARTAWFEAQHQRDQLRAQQQAETDHGKQLQASAQDFHCTIMALDRKGVVVRTAKTLPANLATTSVSSGPFADAPRQVEISYAFLVAHPRQASLKVGDTISCRAYRDGVQETDSDPLPRWVYVGEARHRIPPPPPQ